MKQIGTLGKYDLYKIDFSELKDGMKAVLKGFPILGTLKEKKDFFIFISNYGNKRVYPNDIANLTIAIDRWND